MDKIRKLVDALWYNKERLVLGVMVCILLWHVYGIFNPPPEPEQAALKEPNEQNIPAVLEKIALMPEWPADRPVAAWEGIYTPNPFWALSGGMSTTSRTSSTAADITLLQIQRGQGSRYRAQLKTATLTAWYNEGESFESFQLMKINPESNTVEVMSNRLGKLLTLKAQRN